ncbi:hypothetical protein JDV02_002872 [Purpureocillium takamizusanense]|uniref:Uncharacterized protein n=1 Tax=Purpureocillium takamizusanense TaxID=2060973 RepID=A0A9Q8QB86_9HYPO|nr:uncharacterized protein JDV02_002872 [Purpureocillium takamizusanense]UNI16440.1 hypothetical protein JDV02_002872 [Purpureocillium takamizusanense]
MSSHITNAGLVAMAGRRLQPSVARAAPRLSPFSLATAHPRVCRTSRPFCTSVPLRSKHDQHQSQPVQDRQHEGGNPELPSFSLNGLGASKGVKTAIIIILGIFGTMETWMWCKWAWNWWKGSDSQKQAAQ